MSWSLSEVARICAGSASGDPAITARPVGTNPDATAVDVTGLDAIVAELRAFAAARSWVRAGVLFGSRAHGHTGSDIDFKLFHRATPSPAHRREVAAFARALHRVYAPGVEPGPSDVPYARKTIVSDRVVAGALALEPFRDARGFVVPPIRLTRAFLRSEVCQMRTVLSALTTPHVLVAGDPGEHEARCRAAFAAVLALVTATSSVDPDSWPAVRRALLASPDGRRGKDYLGYSEVPAVVASLHDQWRRARVPVAGEPRPDA